MNDPLPETRTSQETLDYQPISGWAIAGFSLGALFALLVSVSTVVGLVQGAPVFFPVWILALAIAGLVLSLIGQHQIQNSEGTRVGAKLARTGVWVSLVSGLCYASYYFFTGLALQNQANDFLTVMAEDSGFFERLREGSAKPEQLNAAYILTLSPTARAGANPKDESSLRVLDTPQKDGMPGMLTNFKEGIFPRLFPAQCAKDVRISPGAVQDWEYVQGSYKIKRMYRIENAEMKMDLMVTVQSSEADVTGQSRKWFINLRETYPQPKKLTALGEGLRDLRQSAQKKLEAWVRSTNEGESGVAFLEKDTDWNRLEKTAKDDSERKQVTALLPEIKQALSGTARHRLNGFLVLAKPDDIGNWEQVDGRIRIRHAFHFKLAPDYGAPPSALVLGEAILETRQAIDPAKLEPTSPPVDWDIRRIVVKQVTSAPSASEFRKK